MPGLNLQKLFVGAHVGLYRLTAGTIGGTFLGMPILLLTTTGRKTGRPRTTPLSYFPDGERLVVVGSNGGASRDPTWWLNLQRDPRAEIQIGRETRPVQARRLDPEEAARFWPRIVERWAQYDRYRKRTTREIPLIGLYPRNGEGEASPPKKRPAEAS